MTETDLIQIWMDQLAAMNAQLAVMKSINTLLLILALFEVWRVARSFSKKGVRHDG